MLLNSIKLGDEYVMKSSTSASHGFTAFSTQVGSNQTTSDEIFTLASLQHWYITWYVVFLAELTDELQSVQSQVTINAD